MSSYNETYYCGYGSYSAGDIDLEKGTNLYINVGEDGVNSSEYKGVVDETYNGGVGTLVIVLGFIVQELVSVQYILE